MKNKMLALVGDFLKDIGNLGSGVTSPADINFTQVGDVETTSESELTNTSEGEPQVVTLSRLYPASVIKIIQDGDQLRILGIYSNKFIDLEGEIIPEKAHKEYAAWTKDTGFRPVVTLMHMPRIPGLLWITLYNKLKANIPALSKAVHKIFKGYAIAEIDRVTPLNGFAAISAVVLPGMEDVAKRLAERDDLGMSHGFILLERDDKILTKYRSFEFTILPQSRAANIFTRPEVVSEEAMSIKALSPEDREFLVEAYGEVRIASFEASTADTAKVLAGILEFKDIMSEKTEEPTLESLENAKAEEEEEVLDRDSQSEDVEEGEKDEKEEVDNTEEQPVDDAVDDPYDELVQRVMKGLKIDQLSTLLENYKDRIVSLEEEVAELKSLKADVQEIQKTHDEAVAEEFTPPMWFEAGESPSQSKSNVIESDDSLNESEPQAPASTPEKEGFFQAMTQVIDNH